MTMTYNNISKLPPEIPIWQWNCRGLARKKAELLLTVRNNTPNNPKIIMLQETTGHYAIAGFQIFTSPSIPPKAKRRGKRQTHGINLPSTPSLPPTMVATYVDLNIPTTQIDTSNWATDNQELVAVLCQFPAQTNPTLLINVYIRPNNPTPDLSWIKYFTSSYRDSAMVIGGDFNFQHTLWGYLRNGRTGQKLLEAAHTNKLKLINHTEDPTRIGNSVERDTNPDLTWVNRKADCTWTNTQMSLGSDHLVLEIRLRLKHQTKHNKGYQPSGSKTSITRWEKVRASLMERDTPKDLDQWEKDIITITNKHTASVVKPQQYPVVDRHLLNLWDKRTHLIKRYRRNKHNRHLKLELNATTFEAQNYARDLFNQHWVQTCENMNEKLHTPEVWRIFRSLLGNKKPRNVIPTIQLKQNLSPEDFVKQALE